MSKPFELSRRGVLARSISAATMATLAGGAPSVHAAPGVIEEIVVTVQRRAETLKDVPVAVTALTGEFIRDVNLDDVKDLVRSRPGLTGNSKDSYIDVLNVRGMLTNDFGVGGDPSVDLQEQPLPGPQRRRGHQLLRHGSRRGAARPAELPVRAQLHRRRDQRAHPPPRLRRHQRRTSTWTSGSATGWSPKAPSTCTLSERFAARLALYSSHEDGYVERPLRSA
jgi:iron complex outermembrane recepter protein